MNNDDENKACKKDVKNNEIYPYVYFTQINLIKEDPYPKEGHAGENDYYYQYSISDSILRTLENFLHYYLNSPRCSAKHIYYDTYIYSQISNMEENNILLFPFIIYGSNNILTTNYKDIYNNTYSYEYKNERNAAEKAEYIDVYGEDQQRIENFQLINEFDRVMEINENTSTKIYMCLHTISKKIFHTGSHTNDEDFCYYFSPFYKIVPNILANTRNKNTLAYYLYPLIDTDNYKLLLTYFDERTKIIYFIYATDTTLMFYKMCRQTFKLIYSFEFEIKKCPVYYRMIAFSNYILFDDQYFYYYKHLLYIKIEEENKNISYPPYLDRLSHVYSIIYSDNINDRIKKAKQIITFNIYLYYIKRKNLYLPTEIYEYIYNDFIKIL